MPRRKENKVFLHLYIDKNVLEKAKQILPNLSAFVENKLREAVILAEHGLFNEIGTGRGGFEPPTAGLRVPRSNLAKLPAPNNPKVLDLKRLSHLEGHVDSLGGMSYVSR